MKKGEIFYWPSLLAEHEPYNIKIKFCVYITLCIHILSKRESAFKKLRQQQRRHAQKWACAWIKLNKLPKSRDLVFDKKKINE